MRKLNIPDIKLLFDKASLTEKHNIVSFLKLAK